MPKNLIFVLDQIFMVQRLHIVLLVKERFSVFLVIREKFKAEK